MPHPDSLFLFLGPFPICLVIATVPYDSILAAYDHSDVERGDVLYKGAYGLGSGGRLRV